VEDDPSWSEIISSGVVRDLDSEWKGAIYLQSSIDTRFASIGEACFFVSSAAELPGAFIRILYPFDTNTMKKVCENVCLVRPTFNSWLSSLIA
jgi:hypothetical protein